MTLTLATGIALIVALALGWNNPRPARSPDWQAPDLPLRLEARANESAVWLLNHPGSDFTLEMEAIPLSGLDVDGYGLVYRAQDATHYYTFVIGSDGYYAILRLEEGEEISLVSWQQFPHIRRDCQANQLRATCVGPTCRFYINDEYAATVEDSAWLTGDVGLWVRSFGDEEVAAKFVTVRTWAERGSGAGVDWSDQGQEVRRCKSETHEFIGGPRHYRPCGICCGGLWG
jgi:hypothetical protein